MGNPSRRHKPRFLRVAAIFAWALQGILAPWCTAPVHAASSNTIRLGVRAVSNAPPAAITDLLASPNPLIAGQVSITWTAPQAYSDIAGQTVASYSVHLATFSVDSLLGDTTAWWNSTGTSSVTLQPPAYTPQSPGSLEGYTFAGLTPGVTYYFAIRSTNAVGTVSPIDIKCSTPGLQAFAIPAAPPTGNPPQAPNGLLSTSISNGLQVQLNWSAVTQTTAGQPAAIDHYRVQRYNAIGGTITATVTLPATTRTFTENTGGTVAYYRIQAFDGAGQGSALSDYLDSSTQANRYAIASDDLSTRVVMPHDAALYLLAANNPYKKDLDLILTRRTQDEVDVTLRSYKIEARIPSTGEILSLFTFPQNNISVQLGFGAIIGPTSGPISLGRSGVISAATLAQILSVYWFNGGSYVRVGDPILVDPQQSISVTVRNLGVYQIRAVTIGTSFRLTQNSPYPRVITPNGAENRRVFWFFDNPAGDTVTGNIYDIRGAHVRSLAVNGMSPTANSLVWDGHDDQGAVVPSGVYLYKISTSDGSVTGTVVVAR
jgi:hypothetical protein